MSLYVIDATRRLAEGNPGRRERLSEESNYIIPDQY